MMTTLLSKSIRDTQGRLHKRDERLTIVSRLPRADFDTRPLLKVQFEDCTTGVVFPEEVEFTKWAPGSNVESEEICVM
jgi:hypothetical protein